MKSRLASQIALMSVIVVVGGSFVWWFRERPSYLLYQAHNALGTIGQSAAIVEYRRLLRSKTLTKEKEIEYRVELGLLCLRAVEESNGFSRYVLSDPSAPGNPFLDDAKAEFDKVLKVDPENARAHLYLGQIFWLKNLESYAIDEVELSRKKDPSNPEAFRYLSAIYLERGDTARARDLSLQALAITPGYDEARLVLIDAYANLGDTLAALREYEKLSPGYKEIPHVRARHALYLAYQNYWDESNSEIEAAMAAAPGSGPIKINYGQLLLLRDRVDAALGAFAQAQDLLPNSVWPMLWKSRAYQLRGQCQEPERVGEMLVAQWPRWAWGHLALAWSHLCKSEDRKAVDELNEALRLSPDFIEAYQLKAQIIFDRGQFESLGQAVRPMLDHKLIEGEAYVLLSRSLNEQGKTPLAAEMAETAIRMNPRHAAAFTALGEARIAAGDGVGAARAFNEAVGLNPFDPALQARKLRYVAAADLKVADDAFKELALAHPLSTDVWLGWGDVQIRRGEFADAVLSYQNALSKKPYLIRAQLGLVQAYLRLGNEHLASVALMRANELNPSHPMLKSFRRRSPA